MKFFYTSENHRKDSLPQSTRKFRRVAEFAQDRMQEKLRSGSGHIIYKDYITPNPPAPAIPQGQNAPKPPDTTTEMPRASSSSISQADYERLKPSGSIGALESNDS